MARITLPKFLSPLKGNIETDIINNVNTMTTEIYENVNEGVEVKKNRLWNFLTIPNFDDDGVPAVGDANKSRLAGYYFDQIRSHFRAGRMNQKGHFPTSDGQYSAVFGWATGAIDPTESVDGNKAKGSTVGGYQNLISGQYGASFGFNNINGNTAMNFGSGNVNGGIRYQIIEQTFVDSETAAIFKVSGDKTTVFTSDLLVAIKIYNPAESPIVTLNRVVSSTFDSVNTVVTMAAPVNIEYADGTITNDDQQKSWLIVLNTGAQFGFINGNDNWNFSSKNTAIGSNNVNHNTQGAAIGHGVFTKNKGEIGFASNRFVDGTLLRYSQKSIWQVRGKTINTTPVELTIDAATPVLNVNTIRTQNNTNLICRIEVAGFLDRDNGQAFTKVWDNVCIRHRADGVTTILHESTPLVITEALTAGYTCVLSVDVNGYIKVTVTSDSTDNIYWTATIEGTITGANPPTKIN